MSDVRGNDTVPVGKKFPRDQGEETGQLEGLTRTRRAGHLAKSDEWLYVAAENCTYLSRTFIIRKTISCMVRV